MPADNEHDPLDRWLNQQVRPLPPPPGTFELITRRARRRRIRKAVVTVASAAAVAAAVGIAVPVGMSLHLSTPTQSGALAGGEKPAPGRQSALGAGSHPASAAAPSASPSAPATATGGVTTPGYLPPDFSPSSVTWDSTSNGWVIGPAGTPGHCGAQQDSDICTSVARTEDGGLTWSGLPAPVAGSPSGPDGVSGIRFLDGKNGWAFGPELWATHDGGQTWTRLATGGERVTDLETAGNRAYALFATCGTPASDSPRFAYPCTSYTLKTATAGSDQWTAAGAATSGLTAGGDTSAVIVLYGSAGYLVAPDGTLYSGPLGGSWHKAGAVPCQPGLPAADGLPATMSVALVSPTELAVACAGLAPGASARVLRSDDSGATWTAAGWPAGTTGEPASLAAAGPGPLVLATSAGIWRLQGQTWSATSATGSQAPSGGFSYVGMTSPEQGVALPADTRLHEIYMTTDGGQTWQARPIRGS